MKMVRLSALRTGRLYPPRKYFWYSFLITGDKGIKPGKRTHRRRLRTGRLGECIVTLGAGGKEGSGKWRKIHIERHDLYSSTDISLSKFVIYQLMHKTNALKGALNFTLTF
jgi:hypothetical protein